MIDGEISVDQSSSGTKMIRAYEEVSRMTPTNFERSCVGDRDGLEG